MLEQIRDHLKPGAIVTDVGSTKQVVQDRADAWLVNTDARFVGSHPMCGSDQVGIESIIPHLYDGARVVVMNVDGSEDIVSFWANLGAEPVIMAADEHDQLVAATSHLPHMAAVAIVQAVAHGENLRAISELCGTGFRDTTRVANGSAAVWRDIVQTNAEPVNARLKLLRDRLTDMIDLVDDQNFEQLGEILAEATSLRNHLLKKDDG